MVTALTLILLAETSILYTVLNLVNGLERRLQLLEDVKYSEANMGEAEDDHGPCNPI